MGIHKGTKLTDAPKERMIRVRIDKETSDKLQAVVSATGKSISDVVREGIERSFAEIK